MPPLNTASTESISSRKRTWLHPPSLLQRLHEESRTEIVARARAQFQGSNEDFLSLAEEYDAIAPRLRGGFSKRSGCPATTSIPRRQSAIVGRVAGNGRILAQHGALATTGQNPELGSSCGVSTLYFAEALRTLGRGVVVATERDALVHIYALTS